MRNYFRTVAVLCVAVAVILCGSNLAQACNGKGGAGKYGSYGKGMGYGGYAKMYGGGAGKSGYGSGGFSKGMAYGGAKYGGAGKIAK